MYNEGGTCGQDVHNFATLAPIMLLLRFVSRRIVPDGWISGTDYNLDGDSTWP